MTPSRLIRVVVVLLLFAATSIATAATTELKVFFDSDPEAGCTVSGMDGVDKVLVTQITDSGGVANVTRVYRQDCMGVVLGSPVDLSGTPWPAALNSTSHFMTVETRIPFMAFGSNEMPHNIIGGFEITRNSAKHTVLLNADGSNIIMPEPPTRRRSIDFDSPRHITLDGQLADWGMTTPITLGSAGSGTDALRLLRVLAFADPMEKNLYLAAQLSFDGVFPWADDNIYLRLPGQDLTVPANGVLGNDADPQNHPLTATKVTNPQRGSVTLNADGSFTYTPNHPQLSREDEFTYKAVTTPDGRQSNVARVVIRVDDGESPKQPVDDFYTTQQDTPLTVPAPGVLNNDPDKLVKTQLFTPPSHGTVVLHEDGGFTYTPATGFVGVDTFVYTALKQNADAGSVGTNAQGGNATVTITVEAVNVGPAASNDNYNVAEDGTLTVPAATGVLANDSPSSGLTATPVPASGPAHGTLTWNPANNGSFTYQPDPNYNGLDQFDYTATDGTNVSNVATVRINVTAVNDPPSFTGGGDVSTNEDTPYNAVWATSINKGAPNESSQTLTFTVTPVNPALFSVQPSINATTGVLTFTPAPNVNGTTSATVNLTDNGGGSNAATPVIFNITITPVNDAPSFTKGGDQNVNEDAGAQIVNPWATAISPGPADEAGQTVTFNVTGNTNPALFSVAPSISSSGVLTYTPAGDANGTAQITITLSDNGTPVATSAPQTFNITVNAQNDAPVNTVPAAQSTNEDTALTFTVGGGNAIQITDIDAGTNAVQVTLTVTNGTLTADTGASITNNGTANVTLNGTVAQINASLDGLIFNPAANFNGLAQLTITTSDLGNTGSGGALQDTDTVDISVLPVNDQPAVNAATFSLPENSPNATVVGTVTFTDPDAGQTHTFAITAGNTGGAFAINPLTGQITVANSAALDFETNPTFSLTVTVQDNSGAGNDTGSNTITVNLTNVNEAPVNTVPATQNTNEDTPLTFTTGGGNAIQIADVDAGGASVQVTLTVTNGTLTADTGASITNNNTANVTLNGTIAQINASLDGLIFNPTANFSGLAQLTITTNDLGNTGSGGALQDTDTVDINVLSVNDQPAVNAATFSLAENSANSTVVGTVTFTDPDAGQTHTFAITAGNTGGAFAINPSTGQITVANSAALDFETNPTFSLTVTVQDNSGAGNDTGSNTITINLTDVNEAPVVNDQSFGVDENSPNGTVVGTVVATDPDNNAPNNTLTYAITAGNTGNAFAINASNGQITVANPIDFENVSSYSLTVTVTDGGAGPLSDTATITINVNDLNEAPTANDATFAVDENSANGTVVGTVVATDPDTTAPNNTLTYAITAGNTGGAFAINSSNGQITVANPIDFESISTYSLTVTVTDGGAGPLSDTATITINVNDLNEAPVVNDQTFAVDENVPNGTVVGTVVATDPDTTAPNNTLTYAITAGNTGGAFAINPSNGQITVANPLNYEALNSYSLTVTVTDGGAGPLFDTATITININDVNEAPSITPPGGASTIAENTANGTLVTTAVATDPDTTAPNNTLTFSIIGGNTGGAFAINASNGQITVANSAALNFETTPSFTLVVQVTDGGAPNLSDTENFVINLTDVNDAPVVGPAGPFSLPENSPNGTSVGTPVPRSDEDLPPQTLTCAITAGNTGGAFAIDPSTCQITVANVAAVDFETNPTFNLTVTVTDNGVPPLSGSTIVTINLTDANEPPVVNDQSFSVDENVPIGTVVGSIAFSDPDGPSDTFAITAGNAGNEFVVNPTTGQITTNAALNFEATPSYTFTVTITDGGTPLGSDSADITININNVNEAPVVNPAGPFNINENSANGTNVGSPVTFTDTDSGQTHTYAITAGNTGGAFAIDNSGQITVANSAAVNFEANPTFSLTVQVTDVGAPLPNLSGTTTVTVNVNDLNEAPVANDATFAVAENSPNGTVVGTVVATDPDTTAPNNTLTYAITAGNTGGAFAINASNGQITVANPINYESLSSYSLTVTVTDGGAGPLSDTATITINVTDLNEAPTANDATFAVNENVANGTVVGTVVATDPDTTPPNNTLTYSITAGNTGGAFAINSSNGQITTANTINFENVSSYSLTVTVTDGGAGPLSDPATITINVTNINEAPVVNPAGPFTLAENSPNGTNVGTPVTFTEPDTTGQTHTYAITAGNTGGAFAIDSSGQITVANVTAVNYEANPSFTLTVTVTDNGLPNPPNLSGSTSVTINLTDVNDAPVYNDASRSIAENSANGTNVGAPVTATDEDVPAQTLTYAITAGNTGGAFAINSSSGQITVANPINFESVSSYSLTVQVTDNGTPNLSDTATVTITVTDVNEAPTANDATFSVNENVPNGTVVGTVVATDPDTTAPNNTLNYAITAGNTGGAFAINSSNGQITTANTINFEALSSYSLTVTVTDGGAGPLSDTATITINVTDLNEAPTATTDVYTALANTSLHIVGGVTLPGTTVAKTGDVDNSAGHPRATGVKANDTDPDTVPAFNTLTITFVTGNAGPVAVPGGGQATTTTAHGNITLHADGSFIYTPSNNGYTGADSFTYTINDGLNNVTGTVNLTVVGPVIWYVKNNVVGAGTGTSADPFQTLAAAITASAANHWIYVMRGDGTATNYGGSNLMKAGQKLWGQGVNLNVTATNGVALGTLIAATSHSLIGPGAGANETIRIQNVTGVDIQGLSINGGTTNAIDLTTTGGNSGGFSASSNIITAATLQAIQVAHGGTGTATIDIQANNITSTGSGIDIARTAGTMTVVASTNTINSGATGILIAGGAAASSTITGFASNNISGNNVGTGINISNVTFDTTAGAPYNSVSGGVTAIGQSGNGVGASGLILNTVAGDLAFTDLDIYADNGTGLNIVGTGAGNIAAGTGTSVTVPASVAVVEAINGPAVSVNNATVDLRLTSAKSTNTTTNGISLTSVSDGTVTAARFSAGAAGSSITSTAGATGPIFNVSGGNAGISYAGTISNSGTGRTVFVDSLAMDDATDDLSFSGAITGGGTGILLNNNSGAGRSITFSGGLTITTSAAEGFAATSNTNGNGLNITGTNTINSTSATALRVTSTTIGASGLTFQSISSGNATAAADPVNGIVLSTTGNNAGLTVTGTGSANTGGTIQNTTGDGILMTSTRSPSFSWININGTTGSGIKGTTVTNFTLQNSTVNNSNSGNPEDANVNFNTNVSGTENNLSGTVSITNNTLTNSFGHGVNILNFNGTISDLTVSNNIITSSTSTATSKGTGIRIQTTGSSTTVSNLTKATITNNTISNFPSNAGISVQGGNASTTGTGGTVGIPNDATNIITITGNLIAGQSAANRMGTSAIIATVSGGNSGSRSQGNFNVSSNGTVGSPLANTAGTVILTATNGYATNTLTTNNNFISANNTVASNGIGGGVGTVASSAETGDMTWTINSNSITNTDGNGILAVARGTSGTLKVKIQSNTVSAPLSGNREGIRIDAGNASSVDDAVCLNISGNTSAGSGVATGIGLRKQGTTSTVNDFGVNGMGATSTPGVETYVNGLNPAGGGTTLISATSGFSNCSFP